MSDFDRYGMILFFILMFAGGYGVLAWISKQDRGTWKFWK